MWITEAWIDAPETRAVCAVLTDAGFQALFVGGCVRNALLGVPVSDIDIATDARPETVVALAETAGLKAVPTGIEHGTVTVISHHRPYEITTFRRDVQTDGRRAVVAFADTAEEDARRRDFTMNALYATPEGQIIDPLGGLADLKTRQVRFIDNAEDRIREDYLRILRFFRFNAWYGDPAAGLDPEGLAAIGTNIGGLETLSKERVGAEMKKLLAAPDPAPSVAAMAHSGVLSSILPGAAHRGLAPLVALEQSEGMAPNAIRRLAVLGGEDTDAKLRLSREEGRDLTLLRDAAASAESAAALGYRLGPEHAVDALLLRAALLEQLLPAGWRADIASGAQAVFPVAAADLMPELSGAALGAKLRALERRWLESGFRLTRVELLSADS